jgi:adenylosuccinate synthase
VALRHACRINGFHYLAITLFDVLTGLKTIKIATAYRYGDRLLEHFPANLHILEKCSPVYMELDGWEEDISEVKELHALPLQARNYIRTLEDLLKVKVALVSVGPRRDQTIVLTNNFK